MSDVAGNPKDRFSHDIAHFIHADAQADLHFCCSHMTKRFLHDLAHLFQQILHVLFQSNGICKALFLLILGLRIFFQNIKVGGGKKIKIKNTKKFFFYFI